MTQIAHGLFSAYDTLYSDYEATSFFHAVQWGGESGSSFEGGGFAEMDGSEIVLPENELFLVTFTAAVQSSLQAETGSDLLQDWQLKRGIYVTANGGWNGVTTERGVLLADEDTVRNGDGLATSTLTASGLVESGYDGAHKINTFLGVSVGFGMPEGVTNPRFSIIPDQNQYVGWPRVPVTLSILRMSTVGGAEPPTSGEITAQTSRKTSHKLGG